MKHPLARSWLVPLLLAALSPAAHADYEAGLAAARSGDYATTLREWQQDAAAGHAGAQYGLGVMYANGHGVTKDEKEATR